MSGGKSRTHYKNLPNGGIRFHSYLHWECWYFLYVDLLYLSLTFYSAWGHSTEEQVTLIKARIVWHTGDDSPGVCGLALTLMGLSLDIWINNPKRTERFSDESFNQAQLQLNQEGRGGSNL